jgi:hypothetical protein
VSMYACSRTTWTTAAVADGAVLTTGQSVGLRPSTTSMLRVFEVFIGGESTSSTVNAMALRRGLTTVSAGALSGANTMSPLNPRSAATAAFGYGQVYATTYPTTGLHALQLSLNTFGGIIRWVAAPGEEVVSIGAATLLPVDADLTLSAITGTGIISTHLIVEDS